MQSYLTGVLFLILVNVCIGQQPADQKANGKIKGTLNLIAGLPKQGMFQSELYHYFYPVMDRCREPPVHRCQRSSDPIVLQ
jgi:hypothetical protein